MNKNVYFGLMIFLAFALGCSSPKPSERFLNAPLSVQLLSGNEELEQLKIRPADLYDIFDTNVTQKKWKRIHENSWKLVIEGKDPTTGKPSVMTLTLSVDSKSGRDVVVREITEGGLMHSQEMIVEMMRQLNDAYTMRK